MQVHIVVAPVFATNCCVVVDDDGAPGSDAVIVDAGAGVAATVIDLIAKKQWNVRAVAATHGHVDHTWDAGALCKHFDVPMRIHADDAYRLADPFGTLGLASGRMVTGAFEQAAGALGIAPGDYQAPTTIVPFTAAGDDDAGNMSAGTLRLKLVPAPGHTEGSTLYVTTAGETGVVLSGDVLFAGSVGRTDLPGGDQATMERSLHMLKDTLDPQLGVVPGHGPTTTFAYELATNPYLR